MKNKIIAFLLIVGLGLSALCMVQWRQLRAARQQNAEVRQAIAEMTASRDSQASKVKQLEAHRAKLGESLDQFTSLVNTLRAKEPGYASNSARPSPVDLAATTPAANTSGSEKTGLMGGKAMGGVLAKMFTDPDMKEMMRSQQKTMVQKMYGPLLRELNLTPDDKDRFMTLLLDQQMSAVEQAGALLGEGVTNKTQAVKALEDKGKQTEAVLKAFLGEDKFAQYTDYKTTMGERMQLDQLRQQLEGSTAPLQDDQMKSLLKVMKEEKAKVPPIAEKNSSENPSDFAKMLSDETMQKQFRWQEDLNRRVLERSGQILSPLQLQEFTEFQAQQLNMQKASMKIAREMFGGGVSHSPPADTKVIVTPLLR